jgi:hypothetical protein
METSEANGLATSRLKTLEAVILSKVEALLQESP